MERQGSMKNTSRWLLGLLVAVLPMLPTPHSDPVVVGAGAPPIIRDLVGDPTCPEWGCGTNSNQTLL